MLSKKFVGVTLAVGMLAFTSGAAVAALSGSSAFFGGGLTAAKIGNMTYWESSTVSANGYASYASDARNDWQGISNADVDYSNASSESTATIRSYAGNYGLDYAGRIVPYSGGREASTNSTWDMVQIILNDYYMDSYGYSNANRHKTTIHEFGHSLGLVHQDSATDSVMKQGLYTYTNPTSLDVSNIQWKY